MERFQKVTLIILVLILFGCANQLPPSGGEPDRIPPEIIEIYPPNGTTNYNENYFEITFSEYVSKSNVKESIFISPYLENGFDLSWSGRTLEVSFEDTLKKNVTYTVTIGTDIKDVNNSNRMANSTVFAFATGDKIDTYQISGKVYDEIPEGVMVLAYRNASDTLNPKHTKPDYVSQTGNDGTFNFLGLGEGTYRVYALKDEFKDLLYKVEQDKFGTAITDVILNSTDTVFTGLNFQLTREDSTEPALIDAIMVDKNHIVLEFSEHIDSSQISTANFSIVDSTSGKEVTPTYLYTGQAGARKMFLAISDSLDPEVEWYLNSKNIRDLAGNISLPGSNQIFVNEEPDTIKPKVVKKVTRYDKNTIGLKDKTIGFVFNDGIRRDDIEKFIKIVDKTEQTISFNASFFDDGWLQVTPTGKIKDGTEYKIEIVLDKVSDIAGNKGDSVFTYKFKTVSELDFSGAQGEVFNTESKNVNIVLNGTGKEKTNYSAKVEENKFNIENVLPGKYLIWAYEDKNENGLYDAGSIEPFSYSEKFVYYPDTLDLKARWPVGDIYIKF